MKPFAAGHEAWLSLPAPLRAGIASASKSGMLVAQTTFWVLFGAATADGHNTSPSDFAGYVWTHGWGVFVGLLAPLAYRAKQGVDRARATVTLPTGEEAVITKGAPE